MAAAALAVLVGLATDPGSERNNGKPEKSLQLPLMPQSKIR